MKHWIEVYIKDGRSIVFEAGAIRADKGWYTLTLGHEQTEVGKVLGSEVVASRRYTT